MTHVHSKLQIMVSSLLSNLTESLFYYCLNNFMQEQVKKQLLQYGIQLEEFGGDIQAVAVSALNV